MNKQFTRWAFSGHDMTRIRQLSAAEPTSQEVGPRGLCCQLPGQQTLPLIETSFGKHIPVFNKATVIDCPRSPVSSSFGVGGGVSWFLFLFVFHVHISRVNEQSVEKSEVWMIW